MPTGAFIFLKNSVRVFGAPAGAFIFLKNSDLVFGAPAGVFILPKNSICVFCMPAGAFIFLKKSIFVLNMPPGASQNSSRTSQSCPRGAGTESGWHFPRKWAESDGRVVKNECLGTLPAFPVFPRIPRKWWQQVTPRTYLPHAPGVRMT